MSDILKHFCSIHPAQSMAILHTLKVAGGVIEIEIGTCLVCQSQLTDVTAKLQAVTLENEGLRGLLSKLLIQHRQYLEHNTIAIAELEAALDSGSPTNEPVRKQGIMDSATKAALELWSDENNIRCYEYKEKKSLRYGGIKDKFVEYYDSADEMWIRGIDLDFCIEVSGLVDQDKYIDALCNEVAVDFNEDWYEPHALLFHNATINQRLQAIEECVR